MAGLTASGPTNEEAPWRPQEGPEAFLELWGIDPHGKWEARFCALVRLTALIRSYGNETDPGRRAARLLMKEAAVSPVIFWSRMKAQLAPIFQADASTLAAFGLTLYEASAPGLALALSLGLDGQAVQAQEADVLQRYGRW